MANTRYNMHAIHAVARKNELREKSSWGSKITELGTTYSKWKHYLVCYRP